MESSIFRYIESSIVDLKFDILSKVRYSIEGSIFYRKFDFPSKVQYSIESSIFRYIETFGTISNTKCGISKCGIYVQNGPIFLVSFGFLSGDTHIYICVYIKICTISIDL